jgi:hypothetical protein
MSNAADSSVDAWGGVDPGRTVALLFIILAVHVLVASADQRTGAP